MKCRKLKIFDHVRKKQGFFQTKSQITVFIVLGIVILVIFGLVFFVSRQSSDAVLEKKINKIYGDFLRSSDIKNYVSSCLDRSINDGVKLAALQGGKIYNYQVEGGYNITSANETIPFNYAGSIHNVSYGIKAPKISLPDYPYYGGLVENPILEKSPEYLYKSVFALIESDIRNPYSLTALCNYYGPNIYNATGAAFTCETSTLTNISIQQYLQNFIINRTKSCVNFPQFITETKYNISEGNVSGFVLVGNNDLFVSAKYPIVISIKGGPPTTRFLEFVSRPKTRLKLIHELAIHLMGYFGRGNIPKADSNNVFFNITNEDPQDCFGDNESREQPCVLDGMNITRIRDYCLGNPLCSNVHNHYKYSDIINLTDSRSNAGGAQLTFLFVIENRAPVLDYINWRVDSGSFYYSYLNLTFGKNLTKLYHKIYDPGSSLYDIVIDDGDIIEIFPLGIDPDGDSLIYNISNPSFIKTGENNFTAQPGTFTTGANYVIVNVSDNEGLYDYQNVTIYVKS